MDGPGGAGGLAGRDDGRLRPRAVDAGDESRPLPLRRAPVHCHCLVETEQVAVRRPDDR